MTKERNLQKPAVSRTKEGEVVVVAGLGCGHCWSGDHRSCRPGKKCCCEEAADTFEKGGH